MSGPKRHTHESPCPVCGGHPRLPKGRGIRCHGWISACGNFAHCQREEYAGGLPDHLGAGGGLSYAHWLVGPCDCGVTHADPARLPIPRDPIRDQEQAEWTRRLVQRIYREALDARDGPVEDYLDGRGLAWRPHDPVRLAPDLEHRPSKSRHPAMVALVVNVAGRPIALHRTYLRPGGGKANVNPSRMMLGSPAGGAVRLYPAAPHIIVAEGIETALAAAQLSGLPAWSALSAAGIASLELPDAVRRVTVACDHDRDGKSEHAAIMAARRWISEGRDVEIRKPDRVGDDYADVLLAQLSAEVAS